MQSCVNVYYDNFFYLLISWNAFFYLLISWHASGLLDYYISLYVGEFFFVCFFSAVLYASRNFWASTKTILHKVVFPFLIKLNITSFAHLQFIDISFESLVPVRSPNCRKDENSQHLRGNTRFCNLRFPGGVIIAQKWCAESCIPIPVGLTYSQILFRKVHIQLFSPN